MNNRGITLISLIITIIIILILAGVGIAITTSVIGNAKLAVFNVKMGQIEDAVSLKLAEAQIDVLSGNIEAISVFGTEIPAEDLLNDPDKYKPELIEAIIRARLIAAGEENPGEIDVSALTPGDLEDLFNIGEEIINDASYASIYDAKLGAVYKLEPVTINGEKKVGTGRTGILIGKRKIETPIILSRGAYKKVNGEYMCEPDVSGLNLSDTYYVNYNGDTEIIGNKIGRGEPRNWYNYANKQWANIVVNNENLAYFVWIPRYKYKIVYYTDNTKTVIAADQTTPTGFGDVDVKFVNIQNEYKNAEGQVENLGEDYKLAEAFTFGENVNIPGFWMSKYELSNVATKTDITDFRTTVYNNSIVVNTVIVEDGSTIINEKFDVYLNGTKKHSGDLPYTIEGLTTDQDYEITVRAYLNTGVPTNTIKKTIKAKEIARTAPNEPDMTKFSPETVKYVTYDGTTGDEILSTTKPDNWYNYAEKKWANILIESNGKKAYFVWIPRYEYEEIPENIAAQTGIENGYKVDVRFIPATQITASPGYKIPEAFTFGENVNIPGFWMSKYELSN